MIRYSGFRDTAVEFHADLCRIECHYVLKEVTKYNIRSSSSTVLYAAVPASSCVVFRPSQKWRSKENDDASGELLYVFEHKDR